MREGDITKLENLTTKLVERDSLFQKIANNVEGMLWAKDIRNRYMFASKLVCDKLLKCTPKEAVGKTDTELAMRFRKTGNETGFGEVCNSTDDITIKEKKPCRFLEVATIEGGELWLDVKKTPTGDGTVGVAFIIPEGERKQFLERVVEEIENGVAKIIQDGIYQLQRI